VRHRHHGHGWDGRWPITWLLARGVHRKIVGFLLVALALGGVGGAALHAGVAEGHRHVGFVCLALAALFAIWPLAWMATWRIARPLRALADVAGDIHRGSLGSREKLPEDDPGEVGQVSQALRGVADRVARQLRDQRALMAAVSHELRSPLGRARVLVEMAREGTAPASVHDDLQAEIDAMDDLVGDLLAAARIDFEAVAPRPLDAREVALRAIEVAGLGPDVLAAGDPAMVEADPTLLARALACLLDNARRYGGRTVRMHVRARLARVRFEVEDDGPGFPPGEEVRVFEPFHRGPSTGPRPPGEGLGLALVRQIAEAHRGEAGAENKREGGARVWLELPRV
jgi:signal transduction histidine kinase